MSEIKVSVGPLSSEALQGILPCFFLASSGLLAIFDIPQLVNHHSGLCLCRPMVVFSLYVSLFS